MMDKEDGNIEWPHHHGFFPWIFPALVLAHICMHADDVIVRGRRPMHVEDSMSVAYS